MTDNDLIRLFLPIIQAGLVADGYTNVIVKQANQPTQQGTNSGATVYFFKIGHRRYGFMRRGDVWDTDAEQMVHAESQYYETSFQISALVRQYPVTPNQYTASDLVNEVANILQSSNTIETLNNSGVGILRIENISNPYFTDDRDQFEASPILEFTLVHQGTRVSIDPVVDLPIALDIKGV